MFEIPDDDGFWDDFTLEDVNIPPPSTTTDAKSPAGLANGLSATETSSFSKYVGLVTKIIEKPEDVKNPANVFPSVPRPSRRRCERKFPGPAGLLPAMPALGQLSNSAVEVVGVVPGSSTKETDTEEADHFPPSQSQSEDVSNSVQWKKMVEDLGDDAQTLLNKFSIKSLLLRASRKMLCKGKAPLVFGVIETMDLQGADAGFVIRDQTGRMKGSLHKDLIQDPSTALQAGCVLILRQVSVISPSARTHYLNVTPGNIVFTYTPTKKAAVAKRPWRSQPCTSEAGNKNFESSPSLQGIIIESEKELSESIRNFHNNQRRGLLSSRSPSVSSVASPSLFSSGLSRQSAHVPVNSTRFQARPVRPGVNPHPFGSTSNTQRYNSVSRFPNNGTAQSPTPVGKSFTSPGFRQPSHLTSLSRGQSHFGAEESGSYMISGGVVARHSCRKAGDTSTSNLGNNLRHSLGQVSDFNKESEFPDFDFDFPEDNEDGELLQLCDETLSNGENICERISTGTSPRPFGEQSDSPVSSNSQSIANSVISKVFRDCENENYDIGLKNKPMKISNSANVEVKSSSEETFTFKRHSPCSFGMDSNTDSSFPTKRKCVENYSSLTSNKSNWSNLTTASVDAPAPKVFALKMHGNFNSLGQCDSERDSRVQLGQKPSGATKKFPVSTDALSHWDDDITTEDLLLSQLSEEF